MIEKSEERPWGSWHVIDEGQGYKVKRIHVKPGQRLSYQTHEHRSEHWVVVFGIATCVVDGETTYAALTDILGAEDAFGDMDFKVAGTREFVTAIQLDTKLDGTPASVLGGALTQARDARMHILDVMNEAIDAPDEMAPTAPRIITVQVPVDKIGEVIGPKGKMINQIQEETGAQISIEDDGTVYIGATDGPSAEAARTMVNAIANPQMPEVGERRSVAQGDEGVDDRLRVHDHVDALVRRPEQVVGLDDLEALVHQRRRVDGDLGAHRPSGVLERLIDRHMGELPAREAAERAA